MGTTFLKRQKEMKRLEKAREKAERRAQKKLANRMESDSSVEITDVVDEEAEETSLDAPAKSESQN